ncbi:ATP-binding protein [Lentzea sp.]|uniref:ATP-binding protein n=1 Tax=Lentzea sp. TaxID=56099 RepID=UPI002ED213B9
MTGCQSGGEEPSQLVDGVSAGLPDESPPLVHIRRWLRTTFRGYPDDLLDDVLLVCTELVSNAYDHACGPRDVRVAQDAGGRVIRVEVDDGSPRALPTPGVSSLGSFRGRGMTLVDAVTSRWGVLDRGDRKTVWAEFLLGS